MREDLVGIVTATLPCHVTNKQKFVLVKQGQDMKPSYIHRVGGEMENNYYDDDLINLARTGNSQSRLYWAE